jgi:hypothetical protein
MPGRGRTPKNSPVGCIALGAMLLGQGIASKNFPDLGYRLNCQVRKFYLLGLAAVNRSLLTDANQQRPAV